jgi:hypothetical protein
VFRLYHAGSISSKLLQAHLNYLHTHSEGIKGVDGRCLANLTWALAKLDLSSDDSALTTELALMVAPFIIRTLNTSSPQVCAAVKSRWGRYRGGPGDSAVVEIEGCAVAARFAGLSCAWLAAARLAAVAAFVPLSHHTIGAAG